MNYGKIIIFYLFAFLVLFTCLFIYFLFEIFFSPGKHVHTVLTLFFAGQAGWARWIVITGAPDVVCVNNMDKMGWVVQSPMN